MTFESLYGEETSRALGSADTTNLFTVPRRKAAINAAQLWFILQTECVTRTAAITLVDGQAEYDLLTGISDEDFLAIAKTGPRLKLDPGGGGTIRYAAGDAFVRRTTDWLDLYEPGWREAPASTPEVWYERVEGGQRLIGLTAPPDVPAGATWTLQIPYVTRVADMTATSDVPFTVGAAVRTDLEPWHDALPLYAASQLELLRKGVERSTWLKQQAEQRVLDYLDKQRVGGGRSVRVTRSYRRESQARRLRGDED